MAYASSKGNSSQGDRSANRPINSATAADVNITVEIARWRPNRSASSLPRMLAGIASMENTTLTTIGVRIDVLEFRATTNVQNATIQVLMPYSSKQCAP